MAKRVLVCDDAAFMRMMIKDILTKNGYEVAGEAENGAIAVAKYAETKPDLVMLDITMPEMDGIQALKKIKESDPLYVAMTRAKQKLIMAGALRKSFYKPEKWQEAAESTNTAYSVAYIEKASCFMDFVYPAALRHPT